MRVVEIKAALGLAFDAYTDGHMIADHASEREDVRRGAALQLELDFANGFGSVTVLWS